MQPPSRKISIQPFAINIQVVHFFRISASIKRMVLVVSLISRSLLCRPNVFYGETHTPLL